MSKAYKCDVCGKLFESRLVPFWIKSAIKPNETLDICDSCKAEFEHWLDPTKYEECEEDLRSCHTCMYGNCSPSEYPCENCDNYSNYVNEKSKRCGNCIHRTCSVRDVPCLNCLRHEDRPNYTEITYIKGGK